MTAFITKPELEAYIGYQADATKATMVIDAACDLIRNSTGQRFEAGEETILLDGTGTDAIVLPQVPVEAVTEVMNDEEAVTDFMLSGAGLLLRKFPQTWSPGRQRVKVKYSFGYATVPADLKLLAVTIAARVYQQGIVMQETVGMTQVTYATDSLSLTAGEKNILSRYKTIRPDSAAA
jgi:hypothetical protein